MFCPQCGAKLKDNAKFCTECGAQVGAIVEAYKKLAADEAQAAEYPLSAEEETVEPQEAPVESQVAVAQFATEEASATEKAPVDEKVPTVEEQGSAPKKATLGSFLMQRRRIGNMAVPTFAAIIAAFILSATVAYAAYKLIVEVIIPALQPQEAPIEEVVSTEAAITEPPAETEAEPETPFALEYSSEEVSTDVTFQYPNGSDVLTKTDVWTYPVIKVSNGEDTEAVRAINAKIKAEFDSQVQKAANWTWDSVSEENDYGIAVTIYTWNTTYISDTYVCTLVSGYGTLGGPHGNHFYMSKVYDLTTGEEISISQALGMSDEELQQLAKDAIYAYLSANPPSLTTTEDQWYVTTMGNYYVTDQGIVYRTGDYEIGPYSDGNHILLIKPFEGSSYSAGTDLRDYQ